MRACVEVQASPALDSTRSKANPQPKNMTKKQRAHYILKELEQKYPSVPIPLDHQDPYTLLIAVILSAQCSDLRVNQVTPVLFAKAVKPQEMVQLSIEEIADIIRPCGLAPMKSKGIHGLSQILLEKHQGQVPRTFTELEALPAVGHKTASVVLAQAFGIPTFPVDTHIHRLAQRWGLSSGKNVMETEINLKSLFPQESWNKLHLQMIWYGRTYCTARTCHGLSCPICKALFPNRKKAVKLKK